MMSKILFISILCLMLVSCSKNIYRQKEQCIKFKNTGRHISINLKINQYKDGNFYFDTGSPWLIIDSTFYKNQRMSFNYFSESENKGVGNNPMKMLQVLDTIRFSANNNTFLSKYNMVHNLKKNLGKDIDGIVGSSNFKNTPFGVNYSQRKIVFNPKLNKDYQEVKIKFDGYYMYLTSKLELKNGKSIEGSFIIDTGASSTILTSQFISKEILDNKKVKYTNNGGVSGMHIGYSLFASEINIDKFQLINKPIHISNDSLGALSKNKNYIGIIGNDMLENFDIIYHPSQSKIWMKPNRNFNKATDYLYKSFILIESNDKNKGWLVGSIYEESDAYKKGLRHKDEVLEINNISVKKLNLEKFEKKLKPNQKIKLKVKRGEANIEINTKLNIFLNKK